MSGASVDEVSEPPRSPTGIVPAQARRAPLDAARCRGLSPGSCCSRPRLFSPARYEREEFDVAGLAIITEACIGVKDRACVDVCPVQCIYEFDPAGNVLFSEDEAGSGKH